MAVIPDAEILRRLRKLYQDAFRIRNQPSDADVLRWADSPELWAEHEIRHRGKSFHVAEAVVRNCRVMRGRARRAADVAAAADIYNDLHRRAAEADEIAVAVAATIGTESFDPLVPSRPTACGGACNVEV